jgi:hypothetical protein
MSISTYAGKPAEPWMLTNIPRLSFAKVSLAYEKSCRPSASSGNHRLCRPINDASDESKLGRVDSEGTDNLEASATQKDVSDKLFRS